MQTLSLHSWLTISAGKARKGQERPGPIPIVDVLLRFRPLDQMSLQLDLRKEQRLFNAKIGEKGIFALASTHDFAGIRSLAVGFVGIKP